MKKYNGVTLMKRLISFALVLVCLVSLIPGSVKASSRYQRIGVVTCTNVSVRTEPDTRASRYGKLKNGTQVLIVGELNEWYRVDLEYLGLGEGEGFALKEYIHSTYDLTLTNTVTLWADPFGLGIANGEKNEGTTMRVLGETDEWLIVQTCEKTAGSSFIRKSDLGIVGTSNCNSQNTTIKLDKNNNTFVVTARSLRVRAYPDDDKKAVGFLHNGDVVKVIQYGEYFSSIEYELAGKITECWVHTEYLKKIYK